MSDLRCTCGVPVREHADANLARARREIAAELFRELSEAIWHREHKGLVVRETERLPQEGACGEGEG